MKRTAFVAIVFSLCFSSVGCSGLRQDPTGKPRLTPRRADAARQTLVDWLECEECDAGELEAVVKLGNVVVPSLCATLEFGPASAGIERLRLHLTENHRRLTEYQRTHPRVKLASDQQGYVKMYLDNYDAQYRIRAATALGEIGGVKAKKAMKKALQLRLRDDVQSVVARSLEKL